MQVESAGRLEAVVCAGNQRIDREPTHACSDQVSLFFFVRYPSL
jgi:hypothetical protein